MLYFLISNPMLFFGIFFGHFRSFLYWSEFHSLIARPQSLVMSFVLNAKVFFSILYDQKLLIDVFFIKTSLASFVHNFFFSLTRCDVVYFILNVNPKVFFFNFIWPSIIWYLLIDLMVFLVIFCGHYWKFVSWKEFHSLRSLVIIYSAHLFTLSCIFLVYDSRLHSFLKDVAYSSEVIINYVWKFFLQTIIGTDLTCERWFNCAHILVFYTANNVSGIFNTAIEFQ